MLRVKTKRETHNFLNLINERGYIFIRGTQGFTRGEMSTIEPCVVKAMDSNQPLGCITRLWHLGLKVL